MGTLRGPGEGGGGGGEGGGGGLHAVTQTQSPHMNYVTLGISGLNLQEIEGSVLLMLNRNS